MLITQSTAPTYEALRPLKPARTSTFPVYARLADALVATREHPDEHVAHVMATCAGYAYSDAATVAMITARLGLEDNRCLQIDEIVDAMFICATSFLVQSQDGRALILCFRGTEPANFMNWLTDADVDAERIPIRFGAGAGTFDVHGGFYRNVRAIRYEIVTALQRALNGQSILPDQGPVPHRLEALYITGHSLGAAMAAMMAVMLLTESAYAPIAAKLRAVYTFGQPMIGTPELAAACDADPFLGQRVIRYIYADDAIPQLPPTVTGPFAHFGPEYQYRITGDAGRWTLNQQPTRQERNLLDLAAAPMAFLARQLPALRRVRFPASLYDHGPQNYISALTPPGVRSEFGD
jgi:hypothetical protein